MNPGTCFATVLLAAVAVAHLLRLFFGWQVTVADAVIPMWASGVAFPGRGNRGGSALERLAPEELTG